MKFTIRLSLHPASKYNKTMSGEQLQIIPAYFGATRHKFDILSHTDVNGKTTEYFIPTQFSDFLSLSKNTAKKNIRKNCPNRKRLGDLGGGYTNGTSPLGRYNQPDTIVVQESELYEFLFACRNPATKDFRHWVCVDVLPSIRQRGFYIMPGVNIPQPVPQIQYIEKSFEQKMEEDAVLKCNCEYVPGEGTGDEQCRCRNKTERKKKLKEYNALRKQMQARPCEVSGKKGGLRTQANIRELGEKYLQAQKKNGDLTLKLAEMELLLLNLNLNGDE